MARKSVIVVWLLIALAIASFRLADAQQLKKIPRIGLFFSAGSPYTSREVIEAFRQELRQRGYVEGQNIAIEYRYAEGVVERGPKLVTELVRLKVDVIVTPGTAGAQAAKNATTTIPIWGGTRAIRETAGVAQGKLP